MVSKITTFGLSGTRSFRVTVETDIAKGIPYFESEDVTDFTLYRTLTTGREELLPASGIDYAPSDE